MSRELESLELMLERNPSDQTSGTTGPSLRVLDTTGAIALGDSGTRLLTTLVWELRRRGGSWGLAAMCIGVGQEVAMVIEA